MQTPEPHVIPQTQSATQQVVLALGLGFVVFVLSGSSAQSGLTNRIKSITPGAKATPVAATQTWMTVNAAIGWAVTFLILIALADIPATEKLAASFAWLILVSLLVSVGPNAARNVTGIQTAFGSQSTQSGTNLPPITPVTNHPGRGGQPG